MAFSIVNLTMTGSAYEYDVPGDVSSITFRAKDGDVTVAERGGSDTFTIPVNTTLTFDTRGMRNVQLDLTGTASDIVEVLLLTGVI